jgi:hypothetical protein
LNNRYWPGERFNLLGVIADGEAHLERGDIASAARHLRRLKRFFQNDHVFSKFLRRLHRLHSFRSKFGYSTGRIDIADEAIRANQYFGSATRASYTLVRADSFGSLIRQNASIYKQEYGRDVLKTNCTVRFARPDERQIDITGYGLLSDYHNDEYKGISTIVYLCDVTDENGAFSFIPESHLIRRSLVLTAIHQCVEFDMRLTAPDKLTCVPLEFRGSLGIGNFLDYDKTEVVFRTREILEGRVGTFVTFNGQYVLHRGGKPISGSRTAAFFQPEGLVRHKFRSVGSLFFAMTQR